MLNRRNNLLIRQLQIAMAVGVLALTLGACGGEATPPSKPDVLVESGVAPLTPGAASTDEGVKAGDMNEADAEEGDSSQAVAGADDSERDASPATSDGFPILDVGAEVAARGILRIYAAAEPNAPTLDEYAAGDRFVILGPPDDVPIYPVELAGVRWYRVRASDGLVGWVIADGIEPVGSPGE